jgi:Flp pilus assembly pilin Flp
MKKMWMLLRKLVKEEEGMETVEYAVVAALVIIVGVGVWAALGTQIQTVINNLITAMGGGGGGG